MTFNWKGSESTFSTTEALVGLSDFQNPWFLGKGHDVSKSIALLPGRATCFLISDNIIMTNEHVFPSIDWVKAWIKDANGKVLFGYEIGPNGVPHIGQPFDLDPDNIFFANRELDYAVVGIKGNPSQKYGTIDIGQWHPISAKRVNIIQHPEGGPKKIAIRKNELKYTDQSILQYITDTEPGSSGSPLFNDQWQLIGIHSQSYLASSTEENIYYNQGFRIDAIINDLNGNGISIE